MSLAHTVPPPAARKSAPKLARALEHAPQGLNQRRFLIVSAPFGPFSRHLATLLRQQGAAVDRMLFNAGDLLDWGSKNARWFQDEPSDWAEELERIAPGYTDILLFGEGGPYNQAVIERIPALQASVWVLENGYFRPHWITLERNGVNARTNLPRDASGYALPAPQEPPFKPAGTILPYHVIRLSNYHLIQLPGRLLFPRFRKPYTQPAWLQCAGHIWRYLKLHLTPPARLDAEVIAARGRFMLACLQREGDVTLLRYSAYPDNEAFLAAVMDSFAAEAPADLRLVIKNHPLDPGLIDQAAQARKMARDRGIADRVDFIDGGNLAALCRASQGLIVNNSTAALAATGFGTPVKVMGDAFFDFEGLTDQQPLDGFWAAPQAPDAALFARFREHVLHRTQINGSYHDPKLRDFTASKVVAALAGGWDEAQVR
ncbi:capsular biosynthesis protein [Brevundimonas sp.]|uniref:capsular polysaccharide export protein, LipB/KpsS family n=1 Tax=Brevundimonas sp. TaxID=1871086 RepID=UPI0035AF10E5